MDNATAYVDHVAVWVMNEPAMFILGALATLGVLYFLWPKPTDLTSEPGLFNVNQQAKDSKQQAELYTKVHSTGGGTIEQRKSMYAQMVNAYYTLATDFYEYGWGESFHFAHRYPDETLAASILRHEYYLSAQLNLKPGMKVLDVGCGVGGPARNIAKFSGATIVGLNNNDYQVSRATAKSVKRNLDHLCTFQKGDFMKPPFDDEEFDAAYEIEATCHAPDRTACFAQIFRMLKPGGHFAGYEWVTTDRYDPNNKEHVRIKQGIEVGDGLPDLTDGEAVLDALRDAGFVIDEVQDLAKTSPVEWYAPFIPSFDSLHSIRATPFGMAVTHTFVTIMEALHIAPKGTVKMHEHLLTAAKDLKKGGELGIFTPMFFFRAHKPLYTPKYTVPTPVRGRSSSKGRK
jgi:sterol 24-C-methyltransferase